MIVTKPYNFRNILCDETEQHNIKGIVIPRVQRDYAQGRTSREVTRIRDRFLQVLYSAVIEDKHATLDFIYGNVEDGNLIPLDGQQRLTTLFLLHYYVAKHENIPSEDYDFLKLFSYETRISSRDFCKSLLEFTPNFSESQLSSQIEDEAWFLLEWNNDPTVQAMLVMLDSIHDTFKKTSNVWNKLTGDAITFYFLPLEKMGVTDELYIKMNSRGKPLSPFEHFKAELELRMKEVAADIAERIATKIDREWTDLLWPYRNSETGNEWNDEVIDDEFMHYIHFISDIISYRNKGLEIADDFDIIKEQFSTSCQQAKENMLLLEKYFDLLVWKDEEKKEKLNIHNFFEDYISRNIHQPNKILLEERDVYDTIPDLFRECCRCYGKKNGLRPMFPLGRTILLYAFLIYRDQDNGISDTDFRRRLRIVNNLVKNSANTLRSESMGVLLSQVDKIIKNGQIEQIEKGKASFQSKQIEEEVAKLQWTSQNPDKSEILYHLEDHRFINGYINVIGLDHVDWCDHFYSLFDCDLKSVNRAMLAVGDYFEEDGWRYQIGSSNPRTYLNVWRTLFSPLRKSGNLSKVLHSLMERNVSFKDDILNAIAQNYLTQTKEMPVRYYLVKYSSMLPNRFGKYYWRNNHNKKRDSYKVIMMMTEFSFGYNYDIFLKTLFDIAGGESVGLQIGNYSYSEYNNGTKDRLRMTKQELYLTLDDNVYSICNAEDDTVIENRQIAQNEDGIDIEDRVIVGLQLLNDYMNLYGQSEMQEKIHKLEWLDY